VIHIMKLKEQYFDYIKYGTKEYEIRLNDEKRRNIKKGDFIEFQYDKYYANCDYAIAYEIEKVVLYDKPKHLEDYNIKIAPQSYVYIK